MTRIYYFSGSGHSFAVAKALCEILRCKIVEIDCEIKKVLKEDVAVIIFPVYCQNIPKPVKNFLKNLFAKHIVLIATYGKISYGNVLHEAQKNVHGDVIAGAYIPIGHTFLNGDCSFNTDCLLQIAKRIKNPKKVQISKSHKDLLANIFSGFRSRVGTKIIKNEFCDNCGICEKRCPIKAIKQGRITSRCIRCLRCVANCPKGALRYENSWILNKYLQHHYNDKYILYL